MGFNELAKLGWIISRGCFLNKKQEKVGEMMKLITLFPRLVDPAENKEFFIEVTKEELSGVMNTFKKEKSQGPHGCTVDLYKDLFDCVGEDLLRMVEEIKVVGKLKYSINSTF